MCCQCGWVVQELQKGLDAVGLGSWNEEAVIVSIIIAIIYIDIQFLQYYFSFVGSRDQLHEA